MNTLLSLTVLLHCHHSTENILRSYDVSIEDIESMYSFSVRSLDNGSYQIYDIDLDSTAGCILADILDIYACSSTPEYDPLVIAAIIELALQRYLQEWEFNTIQHAISIYQYAIEFYDNYELIDIINRYTECTSDYTVIEVMQLAILLINKQYDRYKVFIEELQNALYAEFDVVTAINSLL